MANHITSLVSLDFVAGKTGAIDASMNANIPFLNEAGVLENSQMLQFNELNEPLPADDNVLTTETTFTFDTSVLGGEEEGSSNSILRLQTV